MMQILIPMAGAGSRFQIEGYILPKPIIMTTDYRTGEGVPMVVAATFDLPDYKKSKIIYIDRNHFDEFKIQEKIKNYISKVEFITIDYLTEGQAVTCGLAKDKLDLDDELIISACDNGMIIDYDRFNKLKLNSDVIVFTHKGNWSVEKNPSAYGWVKVDGDKIVGVSVKKPISKNPLIDNAIVATFWFRSARIFFDTLDELIKKNIRINNEFYIDSMIDLFVNKGLRSNIFVVDKYLCWGTPNDYENYEKTYDYWRRF